MPRCDVIPLIAAGLMTLTLGALPQPAAAQVTRGFDTKAPAVATGEERQRQPNLYVFEVEFKPVRIAHVNVTDPQTVQVSRKQIWYMCYRTVNRSLAARADDSDTTPVNVLDPLPGPTYFLPEFTLLTHDKQDSEQHLQAHLDVIVPEAVAAINQIERRRPDDPVYRDSVNIVEPLPEPAPTDATDVDWIYGVAVWTDVDPETDFFKIVMRGFSNGYELRPGPDGQDVTWRKALVQEYTRRGDRYDPTHIEFERAADPEWMYIPDGAKSPE